jgi:hypothetical protein
MSGPKVVRVITREELVSAGELLLRRLDAALNGWKQTCTGIGLTPADQSAVKDRRDNLEQIFRADRFAEFNQAATAEINFLEGDTRRRMEKAAQARAEEPARRLSGQGLATVFLRQIAADSPDRAELERAASGELGLKDLDVLLSRVRQALFQPASSEIGANQQALAARLADAEKKEDFEAWRLKVVTSPKRLEVLLQQIAELELLGQLGRASELHRDLLTVLEITEETVRDVRLDSIVILTQRAKQEAIEFEKLMRKAALLGTELARYSEGMESQRKLQVAIHGSASELEDAVTAGERTLSELQSVQVAGARRSAVLDGLKQLGYQVHDGLSTATSEGGRLVVHHPSNTGYGVEISAGGAMERLQVRAVAFDSTRDATQDIPAEQRWCDDFSKLKDVFKAQGSEIIIERAFGVGQVPLKVLEVSTRADEQRTLAAPRKAVKR